MDKKDIEDVIRIENQVFPDPWSYSMFCEQLDLPEMYSLITAKIDSKLIGYGGLLRIRDEGHITNLAVDPKLQSKGIGKSIIYYLFLLALKENIESMSLEVRTTNLVAQKLYKLFGFKTIAVRKNYYGYEEDALVMGVENIKDPAYQRKLAQIRESLTYKIEDCVKEAS